jgi:uncharacterized membrane protein YccC
MAMQDAVIIPPEVTEVPVQEVKSNVSSTSREASLERDNALLRDMNKRQEETIRELRQQYTALAESETTRQAQHEEAFRLLDNEIVRLKHDVSDYRKIVEAKSNALKAAEETIALNNAKDKLMLKLVNDRFTGSVED